MKPLLIFIFMLCSVLLPAQPGAGSDTLNRVDSLGKRQGYWKVTAQMKKLGTPWAASQIAEEGRYIDAKKSGHWIEYFPNGNRKSELTYINNRPSGAAKTYFESGHIQQTGTWKGTRWIGEYRLYYETDTLRQLFHYDSLGRRDGRQFYYYPNGNLQEEQFCNHGVQDVTKTKTYYQPAEQDPDPIHLPFRTRGPCPPGSECKGGLIVNGRIYIYDNNGVLAGIQIYKNGKYVGDAPLPDNKIAPRPDTIVGVITDSQKHYIDSLLHNMPCYTGWDSGNKANGASSVHPDHTGNFDGEGYWTLYSHHGTKDMEGWFQKKKLMCGVQYLYDAKGHLASVRFFEEGKITAEIQATEFH